MEQSKLVGMILSARDELGELREREKIGVRRGVRKFREDILKAATRLSALEEAAYVTLSSGDLDTLYADHKRRMGR